MARTASPTRFFIVERPYYRSGGARFHLDRESQIGPREGDVVEFVSGPDADGDISVRFAGRNYDIARSALVDVETILALVRHHGI